MFKSKMDTEAIPERVYTLCRIARNKAISSTELKEKMEPDFLKNGTNYFWHYRAAAEELGLITVSDNLISLSVDSDVVSSIESMRAYINSILEEYKAGTFYAVTHEFLNMNNSVFNKEKNVASWGPLMSDKTGEQIDATNMRAWRFWITFLGFGYLQDMFVIPNANVFLWDIINKSKIEKNKKYSFGEFIDNMRPMCNIAIDSNPLNRSLNYGVSNGLRTLHDAGYIKLEHILDQEDIWNLYPMKAHEIKYTVTNITICK